jgi:nucleotide-binding universal stress UspA family protein
MAGDLANDFAARLFLVSSDRSGKTMDARTIERAISDHRPDLVVLPAPPRNALAFFTHDVLDRMLQTAQVPVLIVGPGARNTR